jgi:hypothetical protein
MQFDWQYLLVASFGVTGIIQWIKGIVKDPLNPWNYISPFLCFAGAVLVNGGWQNIVMNTVLVLSLSQLGYNVLVQPIKKFLGIPDSKDVVVNEVVTAKSFNAIGDVPPDLKTKSNDPVG